MGADKRLFSEIEEIDGIEFIDLEWETSWTDCKSLKDYALRLSEKIEKTEPFSLLGVSMGGMICSELVDILNPEKVVIVSSAKTSKELPKYFTRFRFLGLSKLLNKSRVEHLVKNSARFFGAMNSDQKKLFNEMVANVDFAFIEWSVKAILKWKKKTYSPNIIHIHGDKDIVLPNSMEKIDHKIKNGDHMMIWNKASQINEILSKIYSN